MNTPTASMKTPPAEALAPSTAQHTPGPWRVDCETHDYLPIVVSGEGDDLKLITCMPYDYETEGWTPTDEANARLIAAAPMFLHALTRETDCIEALTWLQAVVTDYIDMIRTVRVEVVAGELLDKLSGADRAQECIDALKAACAKARGGVGK